MIPDLPGHYTQGASFLEGLRCPCYAPAGALPAAKPEGTAMSEDESFKVTDRRGRAPDADRSGPDAGVSTESGPHPRGLPGLSPQTQTSLPAPRMWIWTRPARALTCCSCFGTRPLAIEPSRRVGSPRRSCTTFKSGSSARRRDGSPANRVARPHAEPNQPDAGGTRDAGRDYRPAPLVWMIAFPSSI
jgi:hypothetical protein